MRTYTNNEIKELANIIKKDGVVAVPTDTVYGICASIYSKRAYNRIYKIKNRSVDKLLPIMCADEEQINEIAIINKNAKSLIDSFMPGPITLILNIKTEMKNKLNINQTTIAIRMATSDMIKELIKNIGNPIFMTSANISGDTPCKNVNEVEKVFNDLDGILDGKISFGKASTIIDCTSDKIKIIREGPITKEEITNLLL